jgi:hypothetical protein
MDEQRVPNLEEMDEQEVRHFLTELLPKLSPEEEYQIRHEDYIMEMPQSGERIRGRQKMREFQEAYPNPPTMELRRVLVRDGLWVVELVSDYGGQIYTPVLIIELRDGKMWRMRTEAVLESICAPGRDGANDSAEGGLSSSPYDCVGYSGKDSKAVGS